MRRCLIVGCINRYPSPSGWEYIHVDASPRPIWDPLVGPVPIDVVADMRSLPFEDDSADRIQCWHSLEHVNQRGGEDAVAEFARVLRPGGILDVEVPNVSYAMRLETDEEMEIFLPLIYGEQLASHDALQTHLWGYTPTSLGRLLAENGFVGEVEVAAGLVRCVATLRTPE